MPVLFNRPISDINVAHTSERSSGPEMPEFNTSLTTNVPELGDSDKASKRIESVWGRIDDEMEKMWDKGLSLVDGMDNETVGDKAVGASILNVMRNGSSLSWRPKYIPNTHYENVESIDRHCDTFEYIRKSQKSSAVTCCTFREYYQGPPILLRPILCLFKRFVRSIDCLLASVRGNMTARSYHAKQGNLSEAKDLRTLWRLATLMW